MTDEIDKDDMPTVEVRNAPPRKPFITYDAFTTTLQPNAVAVPLLGYDPGRIRALIKASVTDVYVGKREILNASAQGYIIAAGNSTTGEEICTNEELFIRFTPSGGGTTPAVVSVLVERVQAEW